ncbi:MAG: hypothetical protein ACOZAO_01245 [Patescibacteria group bacterium]
MILQDVYAQIPTTVVQPQPLGVTTLADAFGIATNVILGAGVALTVIFLILGGIKYMSAKGDQKAAVEARSALTNAVIGFIVVIGAFTIRIVVTSVIGGNENVAIQDVVPN